MSVSYTVLPEYQLHYARYFGHHHTMHTSQLLAEYRRDPLIRRGLRSVLDFSRIQSAELDLDLRRRQMEDLYAMFHEPGTMWCVTYYCPNEISRGLTSMQQKMWEARPDVDFLVAEDIRDVAEKLDVGQAIIRALVKHES